MSDVEEMKEDGEVGEVKSLVKLIIESKFHLFQISDEKSQDVDTDQVYETVERPKLVIEKRINYERVQTESSDSTDSDTVEKIKRIQPRFQMKW